MAVNLKTLGIVGGVGALGLGAYSMYKTSHKKSLMESRKDREYGRGIVGAAISSKALGSLLQSRYNPAVLTPTSFVAVAGLMSYHSSRSKGSSPSDSLKPAVLSGIVGALTFAFGRKFQAKGFQALKSFLGTHGKDATLLKVESSVAKALKDFPMLRNVLNDRTLPSIMMAATTPVAHSFVQRAIAKNRRRHRDRSEYSTLASNMDDRASLTRTKAGRRILARQSNSDVDLELAGQIRSFYNRDVSAEAL